MGSLIVIVGAAGLVALVAAGHAAGHDVIQRRRQPTVVRQAPDARAKHLRHDSMSCQALTRVGTQEVAAQGLGSSVYGI